MFTLVTSSPRLTLPEIYRNPPKIYRTLAIPLQAYWCDDVRFPGTGKQDYIVELDQSSSKNDEVLRVR